VPNPDASVVRREGLEGLCGVKHPRLPKGRLAGCAFEDGQDELQNGLDDLRCRRMVGGVEPLLHCSIDSPAGGGGDDLRREVRAGVADGDALQQDMVNGGDDGSFHERLEGAVAVTASGAGVCLGEVVTGGEDDGAGSGRAGAVEGNVALMQELVEASANHGGEEAELVGVVVVEGGAIEGGGFGDVLDGDLFEAFRLHEVAQGSLQELAGAADAGIADFTVGDGHGSPY